MKLYNIGYMTDINLKQEYELVPLDDLLEGVLFPPLLANALEKIKPPRGLPRYGGGQWSAPYAKG